MFCGEQDERGLAKIKNWKCACEVPRSTSQATALNDAKGEINDTAKSACDVLQDCAMKILPSTAQFLIEQLRIVYEAHPRRHCVIARLLGVEDCSIVAAALKELVRSFLVCCTELATITFKSAID